MPFACDRRNSVQLGPVRLGAGPARRRPDADPELAQLALDPDAAPARVFPGQPQGCPTEREGDRRVALTAGRLDERNPAESPGDPKGVVGAPRPEPRVAEGQPADDASRAPTACRSSPDLHDRFDRRDRIVLARHHQMWR